MWQGLNKRRFPRAQYKCQITLQRQKSSSVINTQTENIGPGGICVNSIQKMEMFEPVNLSICLDGHADPIVCQGTVSWVVKQVDPKAKPNTSYDIGIEFDSVKETDSEKLNTIVNKILKK